MMDAKKCDRCRKFYEPYVGVDPMLPGNSGTKYFHPYNYIGFFNNIRSDSPNKYIDLCPDCMNTLRRWMEAGGTLEN